jgi:hypothetical protein
MSKYLGIALVALGAVFILNGFPITEGGSGQAVGQPGQPLLFNLLPGQPKDESILLYLGGGAAMVIAGGYLLSRK